MICQEHYTRVNGVKLCWFEWGEEYRNTGTVLLVHATGFHARCWDQIVQHLGNRHIIAVDMRGHGRSDKQGPYNWNSFSQDLIALVESLDLNQTTGVGHSMGGHALVRAAAHWQNRFTRLVLIDPVIMAQEIYEEPETHHADWLDENGQHPVARRKNRFADARAMFNNFHGRGSYASWRDEVLMDYCTHGLLPAPDGDGLTLACPPAVEAAIYMGSSGSNVYDEIARITLPVTLLRARAREEKRKVMDFTASPTYQGLASYFANCRDVPLPQMTHFIPMENPQLTADYILDKL